MTLPHPACWRARPALRGLGLAVLAAALTTCRDNPNGPPRGGRGTIAIQPVLTGPTDAQAFGLTIDSLRMVVVRPATDTVKDTTVFFNPDSSALHLALGIDLVAPAETLTVSLILSAGGVPLFSGSASAVVTAGAPPSGPPVSIPLTFSGPGAGVTHLAIAPVDSVIREGDSLRLRVNADSAGVPVTSFYVAWSTADTLRGRINAIGLVRAPLRRDTVTIVARTFTGVRDSTRVTFVPLPTGLVAAGGGGQAGAVGTLLPLPLRARVTAADGLGVKGTPVRFRPLTGGAAVTDSLVVTDDSGFAQSPVTLGPVPGANTFEASVTGLTPVTFSANAVTVGTTHGTDITANETWLANQSPHRVSGYLRVRNGATLTIQAGAVVKFDSLSGLQVGDTSLGQAGGLALDGTTGQITLTANSATPVAGFWKGIEVQRSLSAGPWRKALIEWAGAGNRACILIADRIGVPLDLDSLHLRQCGSTGGVVVFDGGVHLHRSEVDSTGNFGVAAGRGTVEVDSSTFRGVGTGILFSDTIARLGPSAANRFLGNTFPVRLTAVQLPGLLRQDSIAGNASDRIIVSGGRPDPAAAVVTLFRQPRGATGFDYEVSTGAGLLDIGSPSGQALVLDSGLVVGFDVGSGVVIGDSAGTRGGTLRSLGTSAANAPQLIAATGTGPGLWVGVEIGRLSAPDTVGPLRVQYAGDSLPGRTIHRAGLLVRNPAAVPLVLDGLQIFGNGSTGAVQNSGGIVVTARGGGVDIRNSSLQANPGYGVALSEAGFRVTGNVIDGNGFGIGTFTQGGTQLTTSDSIAGNTLVNNGYAVALSPASLRAFYDTTPGANVTDTLLLQGGLLTADARLPRIRGFVWRAVAGVAVDSSATFTIAAGDTVTFDTLASVQFTGPPVLVRGPIPVAAGITIGGLEPAALAAAGTAADPILLTASNPGTKWAGIQWSVPQGSLDVTKNVFTYVTVDRAGFTIPCFGDCNPVALGALRLTDTTNVILTFDHIVVRNSGSVGVDFGRAGTGQLHINSAQFYNNGSPMIRSYTGHDGQLFITGSDLYNYGGTAIQAGFAGIDSVNATGNWWGDGAGAWPGFSFQDSLGRASLNGFAVRIASPAVAPFFPVGPAAKLVAARDTILAGGDTVLSVIGQGDSLRVRVVDAQGRGVGGSPVSWSTTSGTVLLASGTSDIGGRVGTRWVAGAVAGLQATTATGIGTPVVFPLNLLSGNTNPLTVDWQAIGALTQADSVHSHPGLGLIDTVFYSSSNHKSAIKTGARDFHGNVTFPNLGPAFDQGLCANLACRFPAIDSTRGDTMFFRPPAIGDYVISGQYESGLGGSDQVVLRVSPVAFGVRIDRDETQGGVQVTPDTALFNSLCRTTGPANIFCQRDFHAFVVDSGLTAIGNATARFRWITPVFPDTTVTLDNTRGAPANDTATVTAHRDGVSFLVVVDTLTASPTHLRRDSLPILVQQFAANLLAAPDTATILIGQSATFRAAPVDFGGDTVRTLAVHWRVPPGVPLTITDTSVANQVTVRLDSSTFGQLSFEAFAVRAPGDTVFAFPNVINPGLLRVPVGLFPHGVAVNAATNRVYVGNNGDGTVSVIDGVTDVLTATISVGTQPNYLGVDAGLNKIYVTTDSVANTLAVVNGNTNTLIKTLDAGQTVRGVAVDSVNHIVYIAAVINGNTDPLLIPIDANVDTFLVADTVHLPSPGEGVAFNPANGLVYVAHLGDSTVSVINPATHTIVQTITVGQAPVDLAVDPGMNTVYVTTTGGVTPGVSIIQASTGIVTATVPMPIGPPNGIAVDPNLHRVYVGGQVNSSYLTVFDNGPAGLQPSHAIYTAVSFFTDSPGRVAYDGANGKVYFAQLGTGVVTRLQF